MEIYPRANEVDKQVARSLLNKYARMRRGADILSSKPRLTEKERKALDDWQQQADDVEMAVKMIMDDDVRRVMEFRFIRGNSRWGTVTRFNSITDRSVDRRIVKGVESVAETLKIIGMI